MFLAESIRVASRNLLRHKLRTALTMLGMVFGVSAVLSMLSIGAGAEKEALSVIQKMGLRNVVIQAKEFDERELQILRQDSPGLSQRDVASLRKALPENTLISGKKLLKSYQSHPTWVELTHACWG